MRLTDLAIKALPVPERGQQDYRDITIRGLSVRISQGGTRTFYLTHGRSRTRTVLGRYPIITLAQARQKAKELLAEQTLGKHKATRITFAEALKLFLDSEKNRKGTLYEKKRLLEKHFLPTFRHERLEDISMHSVARALDRLLQTPSERFHAHRVIRRFFKWAKPRYVAQNPVEDLGAPPKSASRTRLFSDQEIPVIFTKARELGYPFGTITELTALTLQRKHQIGALKWSYISENRISWPAEAMKGNRPHVIPTTPRVAEILSTIPRTNDFVFPARGKPHHSYSGWSKGKLALDKLCKLPQWGLHDFRRAGATFLAETTEPHIIEIILAHATLTGMSEVGLTYNLFKYEPQMREALKRWEGRITLLLAQGKTLSCCNGSFHEELLR